MVVQARRKAFGLSGLCLASLLFGLEISSVPAILPTLVHDMGAEFTSLQWIMNAYTIGCTTVLMAAGTVADRIGRKRVTVVTTLAFALASLICGLAQDPLVLIGGRFLQGLAGGAMFLCTIAVLSHQFQDGRERDRAFTAWGIVSGIGLGFGPLIGGLIMSLADWPWVFLIHAPLAFVALCLIGIGVEESRDSSQKQLDIVGIVTLSLAVFGLSYLVTQGGELTATACCTVAAATVTALIAFVWIEKVSAHPMFDVSVFGVRAFSGAIVGAVGMNVSYWPFIIYLPIYLSRGLGYDNAQASLLLLAYTLPSIVGAPIGQALCRRYRAGLVIPFGLLMIGVGFIGLKIGSGVESASWMTLLPGLLTAGIGIGVTMTLVTSTTTAAVSPERVGMASGIDISARLITLAINIAVMGVVLVEGIRLSLGPDIRAALNLDQQRMLAQKIAAGDLMALDRRISELAVLDPSGRHVHAALIDGFGLVMLSSGIAVLLLAVLSYLIFGSEIEKHHDIAETNEASNAH